MKKSTATLLVGSSIVTCVDDETTRANLHAIRGAAYLALRNPSAAETELTMAARIDGEATEVRLSWAAFEAFQGNIEAQERWLLPLLERDGGVADAWSQIGEIEKRRGNLDAAEKAFTRAIELRQVPHFDRVNRALIRVGLNDIESAKEDIDYLKEAGATWPHRVPARRV